MQGGWSPEYSARRVGTLLTGKVIEWGLAQGLEEYDFLGGDSDYKRRWATDERVMVNLTASNGKTLRGRLWTWNHRIESLARRFKKAQQRKSVALKQDSGC
jgi:CelD/BcsL family acetyltransferase involved in cellulose biosynthesis